jgi:integrase
MPKVALSAQFALTAHCPPDRKKTDYWDTGSVCNGLVLEVRATGGRTWYLRYQDRYGKQRQHKIGRWEDIGWEQVRKTARKLRSEVVLGGDPAEKKAATKAIPTYAELAKEHLAHAKTYQRSYDTTEMYVRRHILPKWGKKYLSDITQPDVAKWLADKAGEGLAPATVEKIRVIFGRSFELAARWNVPGADRNPVRGIPRRRFANARERFLSPAETERLRKAVAQSRNQQLPAIVAMLLLTGARVSEVLSAEWANVDLDRRSWLIPMSKTGKARHVPLSGAVIDVIRQIKRKDGARYLFPSRTDPDGHLTSIKHAWQTARSEARLSDLRIHDLRHSAASFMINSGVDLFAVGRVLGHANHASTMRYSHLANDTLLAAVEAGAKKQQVNWASAE